MSRHYHAAGRSDREHFLVGPPTRLAGVRSLLHAKRSKHHHYLRTVTDNFSRPGWQFTGLVGGFWQHLLGGPTSNNPSLAHDLVLDSADNCYVIQETPAVADSDSRTIYKLDPMGQIVWRADLGNVPIPRIWDRPGELVLDEAHGWLYLIGGINPADVFVPSIYQYDIADGSLIDSGGPSSAPNGWALTSGAVDADGDLYVAGGDVWKYSGGLAPSNIIWTQQEVPVFGKCLTDPAGALYYIAASRLYRLDPSTGDIIWERTPFPIAKTGVVDEAGGDVYVIGRDAPGPGGLLARYTSAGDLVWLAPLMGDGSWIHLAQSATDLYTSLERYVGGVTNRYIWLTIRARKSDGQMQDAFGAYPIDAGSLVKGFYALAVGSTGRVYLAGTTRIIPGSSVFNLSTFEPVE